MEVRERSGEMGNSHVPKGFAFSADPQTTHGIALGNGPPDLWCCVCEELETGGKEREDDEGTLKSGKEMQSVRSQRKRTGHQAKDGSSSLAGHLV